jgi:segregation and condensation protein B
MPEKTQHIASLEALLFIHGEPITFAKIGRVLGCNEEEVPELLRALAESLSAADRGLALVVDSGKAQLVTKPAFGKILEEFIKDELSEELTPASLETLAIVAYGGPLSRARIDYHRGVNSSFILRSLLLRGLVDRIPDPRRANAYLYEPSFGFLKHLGVARRDDLPDYAKFRDLLERFESSVSENAPEPTLS